MTAPGLILREFQSHDAAQVAQLVTNSVRGHWTYTSEQFRGYDQPERFRLVSAGNSVQATLGVNLFGDSAPGAFRLNFAGDGEYFNALYTVALTRLPPHAPLIGVTREDFGERMQCFAAAGFRNAWQSWGAHLDLARFDFARHAPLEERLFMDGYEVERLANDAPATDWTALHALSQEAYSGRSSQPDHHAGHAEPGGAARDGPARGTGDCGAVPGPAGRLYPSDAARPGRRNRTDRRQPPAPE